MTISVGIPFYNEEANLAAAVRSILAQTVEDLEVILCDDGSTDGSLAVARSFEDARVRVLSDGKRRHLPARLNEIAREARGELVARMDADDISHPERFARQLDAIRRQSACDAVGTWAAVVGEHDAIYGVTESPPLPASPRVALERGILAHASMLARRSFLLANPYDERLSRAEDRDLWVRTVGHARFSVVPEPLYVIYVSPRRRDFLAKYAESQKQNRMIARRYGPEVIGLAATTRLIAASFAKTAAMAAAVNLGAAERLVRRRARPATPAEHALIVEAIRTARSPLQSP